MGPMFSIYYNLLLSYAFGIVPFGYNFRAGRFECGPRKAAAIVASVLLLVWMGLNLQQTVLYTQLMGPKVDMQLVMRATEYTILNGNWLVIGVQQLRHLENYQQLLSVVMLFKLVLLPTGLCLMHVLVYELLLEARVSTVHALLTLVTLIPNMAHVNNFYVLLFAQQLTLREINDKLGNLWGVCVRCTDSRRCKIVSGELPVVARLQLLLLEYEQCASTLRKILQLYSLPVALYLLLLLQEIILKIFYQFTFFYSPFPGNSVTLEVLDIAMIVAYVIETVLLFSTCNELSEQCYTTKSAVHRLSLIPDQGEPFQELVKLFQLSLNHSMLAVNIAGMFTMDFEMLVGMAAAISNVVVLLAQFHIEYTHSARKYKTNDK